MKIEILGSGCAKCKETEKHVGEALGRAGVQADVVHINDIKEISGAVFFLRLRWRSTAR